MIDWSEVDREIDRMENGDLTYNSASKLAALYSIRDHKQAEPVGYSFAADPPEVAPAMQGSEFVEACVGVPIDHVLSVLDEHMEGIKLLYPKEYRAILRKLKE